MGGIPVLNDNQMNALRRIVGTNQKFDLTVTPKGKTRRLPTYPDDEDASTEYTGQFYVYVEFDDSTGDYYVWCINGENASDTYAGNIANANGTNLINVIKKKFTVSWGSWEVRVVRGYYSTNIEIFDRSKPFLLQPSYEDSTIIADVEISQNSFSVEQIWKDGNIRKDREIIGNYATRKLSMSGNDIIMGQGFNSIYETDYTARIDWEDGNFRNWVPVTNMKTGTGIVGLPGLQCGILIHYTNPYEISSATCEMLYIPINGLKFNAANFVPKNGAGAESYFWVPIAKAESRTNYADTVSLIQQQKDMVITDTSSGRRRRSRNYFICDFIRSETRSTDSSTGAVTITETAAGIRCYGGTLYQAGIRSFSVENQDLELPSGGNSKTIIVWLKYDYDNDLYTHGISYLDPNIQNDPWTWWQPIAYVSNDNAGYKWSIENVEGITGEVLGRWV